MNNYDQKLGLKDSILISVDDKSLFYRSIGDNLTPEEKEYIKLQIEKSCTTCANMTCRVEQYEKPISDCVGWENNRVIGEYKVLKLTRK